MKGRVNMFSNKYKKVIEILDKKIEFTNQMFDKSLKEYGDFKGVTDQEIYDNTMNRNGKGWYKDMYLAKLEALCELRREIRKEIDL